MLYCQEISLLRRPQAQTLHDESPPIGKTKPFRKIALQDLDSKKILTPVNFMT